MDAERREALQWLSALAGLALLPDAGDAQAQSLPSIADQPWAKLNPGDKPVRGGIYRIAGPLFVGNMNPHRWPVNDWIAITYMHDKLMITDGTYRPTVPFMAESVVREGANAVVMTLRAGITFHDGTPLDAEAVKHTIDWIRTPANAAWSVSMLPGLDAVEVLEPLKLRWKFKDAWAAFEGVASNVPGYIMSPTALKKDPKRFETVEPKGTGAFMVDEASPGNYLKLKRNPNWWLAKALKRDVPYFDGIHISVIPDPAVRLANFRSGRLDALGLDKPQYPLLKDDKNVVVHVFPQNHAVAYRFNSAKGPCTDLRVRRAISHAIDRKALIAGTQHGLGRIASGLYPSDHWAHNPELKPIEFNPKLSRELLAQAGFEKGLTLRGYVVNVTASVAVAEAVKNMLAQVGVTWQVEALAPVAATERLKSGDFDLAAGGWLFIFDPDLAMTGLYHPSGAFGHGRAADPTLVADIESARNETAPEVRKAKYRLLDKRIADAYLDCYLWWEESATAYQKWVKGWDNETFKVHREAWFATHPLWFAEGKPGKLG